MDHPEGPHRPTGNQDHSEEEEENEVPDLYGMELGKRCLLLGLTNAILNLGMWGCAPVSNGQTPLVGIATLLWGL